jgi:hypothetical protein
MYERSIIMETAEDLLTGTPIDRLHSAIRMRKLAEAIEAATIAELAYQNGWKDTDNYEPDDHGRRLVRLGADGTPLVDEALPLEIALARQTSVGAAVELIRDIVNLKTRHIYTWSAVHTAILPLWQAGRISQTCLDYDLTPEQTRTVDRILAPHLGKLSLTRTLNLLKAIIMKQAPQQWEAKANAQAKSRYCDTHISKDDPGTTFISASVDTSDGIQFNTTLNRIADILHAQGDTRDRDHRRATAIGILATPAQALHLLNDPDLPTISKQVANSALPTNQLYVHLHADNLETSEGIARIENIGPVLINHLTRILGHTKIRLTPVIHLNNNEPIVDAYEIPQRIREHIHLRDAYEAFPFSSRQSRRQDLDHVQPYKPDNPGQTRPSNLAPLSRRVHRAKTHCNWVLTQPEPGVFEWISELGQTWRVGPDGATLGDTTPDPS